MPDSGPAASATAFRDVDGTAMELLERLVILAEYRDDPTQEHAQRIGRTAGLLAQALGGSPRECALVRLAAPLHDLGNVGIADSLLLKRGRLTPEEFDVMKTHTVMGFEILAGSRSSLLDLAAEIALTHHERWDGRGYPAGLAGDQIPLAGRLTGLADVFDALTHPRPYKRTWTVEEAVEEIGRQRDGHFGPDSVAAFETLDPAALLEPVEPDELGDLAALIG